MATLAETNASFIDERPVPVLDAISAQDVLMSTSIPKLGLIITADDFGYSSPRDEAIIDLFRVGAITQTSLLVNGANARQGMIAAFSAGLPVGLHLNLTEGCPVLPRSRVRSLIGGDGFFLGKMGFRQALDRGTIDSGELASEVHAQFARFRDLHPRGGSPQHADGHQHVHTLAGVRDAFASSCVVAGVRVTRLPTQASFDALDRDAEPLRHAFYASVDADARAAAHGFAARGLVWPDAFVGFTTMGAMASCVRARELLAAAARPARTGLAHGRCVEWMVHPGLTPADFAGAAGCGGGPDAFATSPERAHESAVLRSEALRAWLQASAVLLSSRSLLPPPPLGLLPPPRY
jgi:predicted glycoside hydrolase/deacetylase ChbG (UPF0249 family)